MERYYRIALLATFVLAIFLCWQNPSYADTTFNRCKQYLPIVIREVHYFIGIDAPYWVYMGQGENESKCQANITSFDGGKGFFQFTGSTIEAIQEQEKALQELSATAIPYDPHWAIRAGILYDKSLSGKVSCKGDYNMDMTLRSYNGGLSLMNKEIARAKSCVPSVVAKFCKRKVLTLKGGGNLDLCVVNVSYPIQVFKLSEKYKP